MTTVRFKENIDVRTNETELSNEELEKKLKDVFGINLEYALDITEIVKNLGCAGRNYLHGLKATTNKNDPTG